MGGSKEDKVKKYVKKISINSVSVQAMIDPGSSTCTIKASSVLSNNFPFERIKSELRGFGSVGNKVQSIGVVQGRLELDGVIADRIAFRIVPDDAQGFDVIVGRTFTELPHVVYVKLGDQLIFRNNVDSELADILVSTENSGAEIHPQNE